MTIPVYKIPKSSHKVPNRVYNIMCGIMNGPLVTNFISLAQVSDFNWVASKSLRHKGHLMITFGGTILDRPGKFLVKREIGYKILTDNAHLVRAWVIDQIANWSK